MPTKNRKYSLGIKALKGGRSAIKKLIAERKKNDEYLIISRNGKVEKVKAKDL